MWFTVIIGIIIIVAEFCRWLFFRKRNCITTHLQTDYTTTGQCTSRSTANGEEETLTEGIGINAADCEPPSGSNQLDTADVPTSQKMLIPVEESNNLDKRPEERIVEFKSMEETENKEDFKSCINTSNGPENCETLGSTSNSRSLENSLELPCVNTTDESINAYPNPSNVASYCPGSVEAQDSASCGSPETSIERSLSFPLDPKEQNSNDQSTLDNENNGTKINNNSENDAHEEVMTGFQQISKLINLKFEGKDGLKVVILHSEEDYALAMALSTDLKSTRDFRAITQSEIETELRISSLGQKDVLEWADVIVPLITDTWLSEIDNVSIPNDVHSTQRLNTRYIYIIHETRFLTNACLNDRSVPVVEKGTRASYRTYPCLTSAIPITTTPLKEEIEFIGKSISAKLKIKESLQSYLQST